MTEAMMADFQKLTSSFSYEDTVAAISFLVEKLKATMAPMKIAQQGSDDNLLKTLFAHADSMQLSSEGKKWTREELYER